MADPGTRWRGAASVRFRITAVATLAVALVLLGTGLALVVAQRRALTHELDETLGRRADDLAGLVAAGDPPARLPGGDDDVVAQVIAEDGQVVAASAPLVGDPPWAVPRRAFDRPATTDERVDGERDSFRVVARRVEPAGSGDGAAPLTLVVGGELDEVSESVGALVRSLLVAVPLVVTMLGGLVWWLAGRTLRPVEAIRAEVAGIGGAELHRRVPVPPTGDEVAGLARTMNAMLARVEEASRRQQQFVADASHELRTPLARMRTELEVDEAHPDTADPTTTRRRALEDVVGLQRLVGDLLYLARSDAGAEVERQRAVDLDDIVLGYADTLRASGAVAADGAVAPPEPDAPPRLDTTAVTGAQVLGRADELGRAVANLADNAVRHARSVVSVTLAEDGDRAVLTVADDGPGIPAGDAERVFDRFTRLDAARSDGAGGTGLGLAIARDIARRHGGTLVVDTAHAPGARLVLTLPLAPGTG
jgi:signal transduction histidine kinase